MAHTSTIPSRGNGRTPAAAPQAPPGPAGRGRPARACGSLRGSTAWQTHAASPPGILAAPPGVHKQEPTAPRIPFPWACGCRRHREGRRARAGQGGIPCQGPVPLGGGYSLAGPRPSRQGVAGRGRPHGWRMGAPARVWAGGRLWKRLQPKGTHPPGRASRRLAATCVTVQSPCPLGGSRAGSGKPWLRARSGSASQAQPRHVEHRRAPGIRPACRVGLAHQRRQRSPPPPRPTVRRAASGNRRRGSRPGVGRT